MRNVRVFLTKKDRLKFVSHLDMNRFMTRIINLSKIPVWFTEGFNPHPYLTFALPLSLGFESDYEIMDIRIIDDDFSNEQVKNALNEVMPEYLRVFKVADIKNKPGKIAFAKFMISFSEFPDNLTMELSKFLMSESIVVEKKGKKGKISTIDLAPKIKWFSIDDVKGKLVLSIILPAGSTDNVNPTLLLDAYGKLPYYRVTRTMIYDAEMKEFE